MEEGIKKNLKEITIKNEEIDCNDIVKSRIEFNKRVKSYKIENWFSKPFELNPLVLSRYGYNNIEKDTICCVVCSKIFIYKKFEEIEEEKYSKLFKNNLKNGHNKNCLFFKNKSPKGFASMFCYDNYFLFNEFFNNILKNFNILFNEIHLNETNIQLLNKKNDYIFHDIEIKDKNEIEKNEIEKNEIEKNEIEKNEIEKNEIEKNEIEENEIEKNEKEIKEIEENIEKKQINNMKENIEFKEINNIKENIEKEKKINLKLFQNIEINEIEKEINYIENKFEIDKNLILLNLFKWNVNFKKK
jgi:flagellar biosynthesis GTPase FlhF